VSEKAKKVDDGGPAFPVPTSPGGMTPCGMSLRDWFAGQVLSGLYSTPDTDLGKDCCDMYAEVAYDAADAMLAARKAGA
jgi:hypothetical protein